jgi:DNA-binding Lrp family transcriptional regulator
VPKTNTKERVIDYIQNNGEVTPHDLSIYLGISPQALYRHLKQLIHSGLIHKIGLSPRVFYKISTKKEVDQDIVFSKEDMLFLEKNFYYVSPIGEGYEGLSAMKVWCKRQSLPLQKTIDDYKKTLLKYDMYKTHDRINGIEKIEQTFEDVYLDELYYFDFYAIERFEKTKLGYYLLYSKQGQSLSYMKKLVHEIKPRIERLINDRAVDGIAFTPPTVKRELQIMKLIEKECHFNLRVLRVEKLRTEIIVPQKTLSQLSDRIMNARKTMLVTEKAPFNRVLLIDDAVGSGSTLNEIAKQIKEKNSCKHVIGCAITGSFKGFEVLNEV